MSGGAALERSDANPGACLGTAAAQEDGQLVVLDRHPPLTSSVACLRAVWTACSLPAMAPAVSQ